MPELKDGFINMVFSKKTCQMSCSWAEDVGRGVRFSVTSDADHLLFGEIRRFFDQMGHFCESSRTDENNLGVLGESWAAVKALSYLKN